MLGAGQTLVIILDPTSVRNVFGDWPRHIYLAVAMTADGDCKLIVHHEEEQESFPRRLVRFLSLPQSSMVVVPAIEGFATTTFRYSDERRLMELLKGLPTVVEAACDYAANFDFALEEGIDPQSFVGFGDQEVELDALPLEVCDDTRDEGSAKGQLPTFLLSGSSAPINTPKVRNLAQFRSRRHQTNASMQVAANSAILVISNGGGETINCEPSQVFLCSDLRTLAIRIDGDGPDLPGRIEIQTGLMSDRVTDLMETCTGNARREPGFIIFEMEAPKVSAQNAPLSFTRSHRELRPANASSR